MSTLASSLLQTASAVAALGASVDEIAILDDASVMAGLGLVRDHRLALQAYELALSAEIARRSDHRLGYEGLARKNGSATPAIFIQSLTGSSIEDATQLARLGQSMAEAQDAGESSPAPITTAALDGGITVAAADAIRKGLGEPDAAVTAEQLAAAAEELIARAGAGGLTPEQLLKAARRARGDLDLDAIERGAKTRAALRHVRVWRKDGMCGGSWALPDEDGGLEIYTSMKLLVAAKTGGPRFADVTKESAPTPDPVAAVEPAAEIVDDRTVEQVMADGFAQIFHNGLTTDPSIVPGVGRAAVRVMVPREVLDHPHPGRPRHAPGRVSAAGRNPVPDHLQQTRGIPLRRAAPSPSDSTTTATPSTSDANRGCTHGRNAPPSEYETAAAGSPAATNPPPGAKPTTSTTGPETTAPPQSRTASSCAGTTTCSSTNPDGTSPATPTTSTGSPHPNTATPTGTPSPCPPKTPSSPHYDTPTKQNNNSPAKGSRLRGAAEVMNSSSGTSASIWALHSAGERREARLGPASERKSMSERMSDSPSSRLSRGSILSSQRSRAALQSAAEPPAPRG